MSEIKDSLDERSDWTVWLNGVSEIPLLLDDAGSQIGTYLANIGVYAARHTDFGSIADCLEVPLALRR